MVRRLHAGPGVPFVIARGGSPRRLMSWRNIGCLRPLRRALNAFEPIEGSFAHAGTSPRRAASRRQVGGSVLAESSTIATRSVGATLKGRGRSSPSSRPAERRRALIRSRQHETSAHAASLRGGADARCGQSASAVPASVSRSSSSAVRFRHHGTTASGRSPRRARSTASAGERRRIATAVTRSGTRRERRVQVVVVLTVVADRHHFTWGAAPSQVLFYYFAARNQRSCVVPSR